jgi:hypothetical protein
LLNVFIHSSSSSSRVFFPGRTKWDMLITESLITFDA